VKKGVCNRGGGQGPFGKGSLAPSSGPLLKRDGSIWIFVHWSRVPSYATADGVGLPTWPGRCEEPVHPVFHVLLYVSFLLLWL